MKYEYSASESGILSHAQAVIVGKELTKIEKQYGCIQPKTVWKKARSASSGLHSFFVWDVNRAAESHWLDQARRLIRSVTIIPIQKEPMKEGIVRAFVNVSSNDKERRFKGRAYISMPRALSDPEYTQQLLQDALNEANQFRMKYEHLKALSKIIKAIEVTVAELEEAA